jgi:protein-tyrosine phosphatase
MDHVFWLKPGILAGRSGPDKHHWRARELHDGGIRAILSVNDGAVCHPEDFVALGMSYCCQPLSDNAPPRDGDVEHCLAVLPLAYEYVRGELDSQRPVLVHCRSGKDRTGLFMSYFLMRESGGSVDDAIRAVRKVRPIALSAQGWDDFAVQVLNSATRNNFTRS